MSKKETVNTVLKEEISSFYIPIILNQKDLERSLNEKIDGTIFDDKITEDNLQILVNKVGDIKISVKDTTILYSVPLHIWLKKDLLIGGIAADGDIVLNFQTNFQLLPDWKVNTHSEIVDYDWIKKPRAKVLGFHIPVTAIAERVIETSKNKVTKTIDAQVNESFPLKQYAIQAWTLLQQPILVSELYESRFKFTPSDLAISPFKTEKDTIISTLFVKGKTQVGVGPSLNFEEDTPLLPLEIVAFKGAEDFNMHLISKIPFKVVEELAIKNFKGEPYSFGKKKIIIEDIKLEQKKNYLSIRVKTRGDYEGWLLLKGIPTYNKIKNHIEVKDIEFSLDTKNFLLNSSQWLISGFLTNKLEGSLYYSLQEGLFTIQQELQAQISNYKIYEGVSIKGNVLDLKVKNAFIKEESIMIGVQLKGAAKILIDSIP